jgi:hypothetical protein
LNVKNGNNNNFTYYDSTSNPDLTCIFVDDAAWSAANWTQLDASSTFVETQAECDALGIDDVSLKQSIEIYPNPTSDILYFTNSDNIEISKINFYNTLGQKVVTTETINEINISNLKNGIYYVTIESINGNKITYKLIKE